MPSKTNGRFFQCVIVDLNTQHDFCCADGLSPVANLDTLIPALRNAIAWTKRNGVPVVSSVESHRPGELSDSGHALSCIDGTLGQRKMDFTLLPTCARVEVDNTLCCPIDLFDKFQQVIFRKRSDDLLLNPKADRFFTQIPTLEFLLIGVGSENSVKTLALGLLARGRKVSIVVDACGYWTKATADLCLRQAVAKGAHLMSISALLRRKLERDGRYRRNGTHLAKPPKRHAVSGNGSVHDASRARPDGDGLSDSSRSRRITDRYGTEPRP